jgi:hypothetical protein
VFSDVVVEKDVPEMVMMPPALTVTAVIVGVRLLRYSKKQQPTGVGGAGLGGGGLGGGGYGGEGDGGGGEGESVR